MLVPSGLLVDKPNMEYVEGKGDVLVPTFDVAVSLLGVSLRFLLRASELTTSIMGTLKRARASYIKS